MNIINSLLFEEQFKALLLPLAKENPQETKKFKMYLDTIIINLPTKLNKYKKSVYFNDDNIRDIEHHGLRIPFYHDQQTDTFVLLGILPDKFTDE